MMLHLGNAANIEDQSTHLQSCMDCRGYLLDTCIPISVSGIGTEHQEIICPTISNCVNESQELVSQKSWIPVIFGEGKLSFNDRGNARVPGAISKVVRLDN